MARRAFKVEDSGQRQSRYAGLDTIETSRRELAPRELLDQAAWLAADALYSHTVILGDRLDTLAASLLGDSRLWWILADLNPETVPDTHLLQPGATLLVPKLPAVANFQ